MKMEGKISLYKTYDYMDFCHHCLMCDMSIELDNAYASICYDDGDVVGIDHQNTGDQLYNLMKPYLHEDL